MTNEKSVIGKAISKVPNRHKPYFEVDSNNVITSYKRNVRIDTVFLKARLTKVELEEITDSFNYRIEKQVQGNDFVRTNFIIDLTASYGVYIKLQPYSKSVNAEIQLHSKFTNNLAGNSSIILDILNNPKWFIVRLDVATDYVTLYNNSAFLRTHGNKKQENYETSSWSGSTANPNKTAIDSHYDRIVKDSTLETKYRNRFEVKLYFKESDKMTFANLNHRLITERLQKEMFVPCLAYSVFHENKFRSKKGQSYLDLIKLAKVTKNENAIRFALTDSQWKTFRKHFKACRDDIEQAYLEASHFVYDFLLPTESIDSRYNEREACTEPSEYIDNTLIDSIVERFLELCSEVAEAV